MTDHPLTAATALLMLFGVVAAVDGLYLHLWKYRLYARPESHREHKLHTAQGILFITVVFLLFYGDFGGAALWAVALALAAKPLAAWSFDAPLVTGPGHEWTSSGGLQMVVGNLLVVGLRLWLMLPRYQRQPGYVPAAACCAA